jgi:hypothetical protein
VSRVIQNTPRRDFGHRIREQLASIWKSGGTDMDRNNRDLLNVLRSELEFLKKGGYRTTARADWRPHFIFQDSPTCLNFDPTQHPRPCSECILTQLVPENMQQKKIPCRYIPLNERGETIDSFYRSATQEELESELRRWLKATIEHLEKQKTKNQAASELVEIHVKATGTLAD